MADLFGAWVPDEWIQAVFEVCEAAPQHRYMFLTKNPQRYCELANAGKLPELDNFWYGSTITKAGECMFAGSIHWNTFLSIEPLLEPLDVGIGSFGGARWIELDDWCMSHCKHTEEFEVEITKDDLDKIRSTIEPIAEALLKLGITKVGYYDENGYPKKFNVEFYGTISTPLIPIVSLPALSFADCTAP